MQAGAISGNVDVALSNSGNRPNQKFPPMSGQLSADHPSTEEGAPIIKYSPADDVANGSSSQSVTTKVQSIKRVANGTPLDKKHVQYTAVMPTNLPEPEHHPSVAQVSAKIAHLRNRSKKNISGTRGAKAYYDA